MGDSGLVGQYEFEKTRKIIDNIKIDISVTVCKSRRFVSGIQFSRQVHFRSRIANTWAQVTILFTDFGLRNFSFIL